MQQQQQQQQQQRAGVFSTTTTVTTDHIQQYLDENKALILKILENQNTGKLRECAENQSRLQRNLMYLAAIADCQPKPSPMYLPPSLNYMQPQQSQQIFSQPPMVAQSQMLFAQQPPFETQKHHPILQSQLGISSPGTSEVHTPRREAALAGKGSMGFPDFGQAFVGDNSQGMSRVASLSRTDGNTSSSSAEVETENPQKKGKFSRETT